MKLSKLAEQWSSGRRNLLDVLKADGQSRKANFDTQRISQDVVLGELGLLCNVVVARNQYSSRLASPVLNEGHDAGPIVRIFIAGVKLLHHFRGNVTRLKSAGVNSRMVAVQ